MVRHSMLVPARRHLFPAAILVAACAFAAPASAQNDKMAPIEIPAQPDAIELGTGPLPGATTPESWHSQYGSMFARNVTVATLTPFLPDPSKASGAAVIVAPGGGFRTLSMENEGWNVARALAARASRRSCSSTVSTRRRRTSTPSRGRWRDVLERRPAAAARPPIRRRRWRASRRRSPTPTPPSRSSGGARRSGMSIPTASA